MKTAEMVFLSVASTMVLLVADVHTAGHVFGWTQYRQEDLLGIILGGVTGAFAGWVVVRRMNTEKSRRPGNQPS